MKFLKVIIICIAALSCLMMLTYICFTGSEDASKMYLAKNRYVKLDAVITNSEHYTYDDEGTEKDRFRVYVSYDFDSEHYSNVHYDNARSKPTLGEKVSVRIDPENPNELLPDSFDLVSIFFVVPVFLLAMSLTFYFSSKYFLHKLFSKPLPEKSISETAVSLISIAVVIAILSFESVLFYIIYDSFAFLNFAFIALILTLFILLFLKIQAKKSNNSSDKHHQEY